MGIPSISCKCLKTCKDYTEEVDLAKGDYLRSRTGNFKINNDPRNLAPFKQVKTVSINAISGKDENINIQNNENKDNKDNNIPIKETLRNPIIEEPDENKHTETYNNIFKTVTTLNKEYEIINTNKNDENENNNDNDNSFPKNTSSFRYIKNFDKNIFYTDKLRQAEKNFDRPLNYEKDWTKYCDDVDNEDLLTLINTMNSNKGENHTKEEGQVIEYKGEKYLYKGELDKNQRPIGFGILYTINGEKYEGNFSNGKLIGLGRYIDKEGICYEGIFENNNLVSKAKIIQKNDKNEKTVYYGDVLNYKKAGKGEETCERYKYTGEFLDNLRHGYGCLQFLENGDYYEGEFQRGEITGKGKYIWSNNTEYEGDFVSSIKHGKGKYKWPDGMEYEGDYNNGIREGMGIYKWTDGRIFKGKFKNGKPDGKGKLTYKGKTVNFEYINGKPTTDWKQLFQKKSKNI